MSSASVSTRRGLPRCPEAERTTCARVAVSRPLPRYVLGTFFVWQRDVSPMTTMSVLLLGALLTHLKPASLGVRCSRGGVRACLA
jgi:hypothetical protein